MSVRDRREPVSTAIGVGSLVGLVVLAIQPATAIPEFRIGPAPLLAAAIGTVGAEVWLLARGGAGERFGDTWEAIAEEVDQ